MDSRDRFIDATAELLWDQGIEATSPAAILAASGLGHGSLYHQFSGKGAVVDAAVASLAADLRVENDALLGDGAKPSIERIRAYLAKERDSMRGCRIGRLVFDPALGGEAAETVDGVFDELTSQLTELVAEAQAEGDLPAGLRPADTAAAIVAAVQGGYVLSAATSDASAMKRALAGTAALLSAPIKTGAKKRKERR